MSPRWLTRQRCCLRMWSIAPEPPTWLSSQVDIIRKWKIYPGNLQLAWLDSDFGSENWCIDGWINDNNDNKSNMCANYATALHVSQQWNILFLSVKLWSALHFSKSPRQRSGDNISPKASSVGYESRISWQVTRTYVEKCTDPIQATCCGFSWA